MTVDMERIEIFKQFAKFIEYPMVIFEAETGKVLEINYDAEVILGKGIKRITVEPGRSLTKFNFWEMLHGKKSLTWHRIRMVADEKELLVSGLINEATVEGMLIYTILFERRADLNIGSLTLERIVNHAGIVALHMAKQADGYQVEYVSQNINQYGYTRAQLYEQVIQAEELVCPEDQERVIADMRETAKGQAEECSVECRIYTEERQLIPVRLLVHFVYNEYGSVTDLEVLVMDLREELKRNRENRYLSNAIDKMKSVVLVKSYKEGKRILKYISSNAAMVGMNTEALRQGNKLTEDYIHPGDRDGVIDTIYQAVANGVTDYVQTYRMVRDDGKMIWVENDVTVHKIADGEAEISFLLTDITEQKEMEAELAATFEVVEPVTDVGNPVSLVTVDKEDKELLESFRLMAQTLTQNADYYSVVLSGEGTQLTEPSGPAKDLGQFYDLFERPLFREQFQDLAERAKEQEIPQSTHFALDSLPVYIVLAPIQIEGNITAYWTLTSFDENGGMLLSQVAEQQWKLANTLAASFYAQEAIRLEGHRTQLVEMQLHREQQEHRAMEDIISALYREGESCLGEMCQKAGVYLSVEYIGIYLQNKERTGTDSYFVWNQAGEEKAELFDTMRMREDQYQAILRRFAEDPMIVLDKKAEDSYLKGQIRQLGMGGVILCMLPFTNDLRGYLMVATENPNREFEQRDIHFVKNLVNVMAGVLQNSRKSSQPEMLREGFLDAYNHIRDAVFVKNNRTGEIIFANKAMDKLFEYSLVGMQASEIINDRMDQYRNIQGVRRRFIANKKVTKWQSYMKELDQIMNIVEVHLDTISGTDCSLVIIKKNKNKDKK